MNHQIEVSPINTKARLMVTAYGTDHIKKDLEPGIKGCISRANKAILQEKLESSERALSALESLKGLAAKK